MGHEPPPSEGAQGEESGEEGGEEGTAAEERWNWYQLSPDDSTSMATAQLLKANQWLFSMAPRAHEVINYYDPPASLRTGHVFPRSWETEEGWTLALDARRGETADGMHTFELLAHVYAPLPPEAERRPWTLHLCVDVSGSMQGDRLDFTKEAMRMLVQQMRAGDRISLTTFDTDAELVFGTLDVSEHRSTILKAIDELYARGATNMRAGLDIAYAEASSVLDGDAIHRVLLFSDGAANVGETDLDRLGEYTSSQYGDGIYLSGIGVGSHYDFARMNAITDAGRGAHVFLPNREEVDIVFGPMLRKIIEVAADQVSIEVMVPESMVLADFSGEETADDPERRVQNIVLAAGDDFTLIADFETEDESAFDKDMWFIFHYTPLGGEPQVFRERFAIAELLETEHPLLDRTRLLQRYARWAIGHISPEFIDWAMEEPCALADEISAFSPTDEGLLEVRDLIRERASCG